MSTVYTTEPKKKQVVFHGCRRNEQGEAISYISPSGYPWEATVADIVPKDRDSVVTIEWEE